MSSLSSSSSASVAPAPRDVIRPQWPYGILKVCDGPAEKLHELWGEAIVHELPGATPEAQMLDTPSAASSEIPADGDVGSCLTQQVDGYDHVTLHCRFHRSNRPAYISFESMGATGSQLHFLKENQEDRVRTVHVLGMYEPISWNRWQVRSYTRMDGVVDVVLRLAKFFAWPAERVCANSYIARTHTTNTAGVTSDFRICTFVLLTHEPHPKRYVEMLKTLLEAIILKGDARSVESDPRLAAVDAATRQQLVELFLRFAPLHLHRHAQTTAKEQLQLFDWLVCNPEDIGELQWRPSHMVMFISHAHLFGPMVLAGVSARNQPWATATGLNEVRIEPAKLLKLMHDGQVHSFNWNVQRIGFGVPFTPNPLHRATTQKFPEG